MSRILPGPAGVALLAAVIALATAFGAGHRPASAANASVSIADFAFSPGAVTVSVGDTVTWMNNDAGVPHTVSSDTGSELASGQLAGGASYQKTFATAGTYAYHCNIHPSMTGQVVVTAAQATATAAATAIPTPTPTPAASATAATATGTATTQATATNTPTSAATSTPAGGTPPVPTPTRAPGPPATGDGDGADGDTATLVTSGLVAIAIVLAAGSAVYFVRRRNA